MSNLGGRVSWVRARRPAGALATSQGKELDRSCEAPSRSAGPTGWAWQGPLSALPDATQSFRRIVPAQG